MAKSKKSNSKKSNILEKYNGLPTKGNIQNTFLKGAVDTVAGSVVGTGIGALSGNKAPLAGIALILAGHYLGDDSGVMRLTGASAIAYGIGKAQEYKRNPEMASAGNRLGELKQDLLGTFFLKWKEETSNPNAPKIEENKKQTVTIETSNSEDLKDEFDLSELDGYVDYLGSQREQVSIDEEEDFEQHFANEEDDTEDDDFTYQGVDITLI